MSDLSQQKERGNSLRKQGRLEEALLIYRELWNQTKDKFDGAGYLHCLRKLKLYEEALPLAEDIEKLHKDFNWCRNEIIWTFIGSLKSKKEHETLSSIMLIANKIITLRPDDLQKNTTVLFVLKKLKQFNKMDVACQWIDRVNPMTLDKEPLTLEKGTTGWSNYLIWHYHKVRCLIHQNQYVSAIKLVDSLLEESSEQKKFFNSLAAEAYEKMGETEKAIQILTELCKFKKTDWWIVRQYANVLKNNGDKKRALEKMYQAASLSFKLDSIVTLLHEISLLCKDLNRIEESYYHMMLFKYIRENNKWLVKEDVDKFLLEAETTLHLTSTPNFKEVLRQCRKYWAQVTTIVDAQRRQQGQSNKKPIKILSGYLVQVKDNKPFCFIKTTDESFFCYKSDIKGEAKEGLKVQFNIIPSFDKKKNKESCRAINVGLL
jgi:tetratricopeptide (TPR) repeat protein